MAIISSHTLNGMNGTHAGELPVRVINITKIQKFLVTILIIMGR